MTNEQLVLSIQAGETHFMGTLWEQVERFALQQIGKFYSRHADRCKSLSVDMEDLRQEAYLALYGAIEGYNADKGVKFLTYANYHFTKCFYTAVGLHRATRKYSEVSFDFTIAVNDKGEALSLLDTMADDTAEAEFDNIAEYDYWSKVTPILQQALSLLGESQKETAIACFGQGLSYSEFARQRGTGRAATRQAGIRALANLRANTELAACAL